MDRKQLIKWLAGIVARGLAWFFAVKLGMASAEAQSNATMAAEATASLALLTIAIYTSVKGRKKLLSDTPTPCRSAFSAAKVRWT